MENGMPLSDREKSEVLDMLLLKDDNLDDKSRALLVAINEKAAQNDINIAEQNEQVVTDLIANLSLSHVLEKQEAVDQLFKVIEVSDTHRRGLNSLLQANPMLSDNGKRLLTALYAKLADELDNIALDRQTPDIIATAIQEVKSQADNADFDGAVAHLFTVVKKKLQKQSDETHEAFASQQELGVFNDLPLHERNLTDELQDHDMVFLMPKSASNMEVLSPANLDDQASLATIAQGINLALVKGDIEHIIFPIGPGHWRGACLTKPREENHNRYKLELFDSFGPISAQAIQQQVTKLLTDSGIDPSRVDTTFYEPPNLQNDYYACGDFTCAYCHTKMQELGATREYNQTLIDTLVNHGNENGALRAVTRHISQARLNGHAPVVAPSPALVDTAKKVAGKAAPVVSAQSEKYKNLLEGILNKREEIFDAAEKVKIKEKKSEQLTDEELAIKLQAEELENSGYRRGPK